MQFRKLTSQYYGPLYVLSNDANLHPDMEIANAQPYEKPRLFSVNDTVFRFRLGNISRFTVNETIQFSPSEADYHCMEHDSSNCCILRSTYEELFATHEEAELHKFKVNKILEESMVNQEPVYEDFKNRPKVGNTIYDVETRSIRIGKISNIHDWPNGKGCLYHIVDKDDSGKTYHFHSDSPFISFNLMDAVLMAQAPQVKKIFNVGDILYDVGLDRSILKYRVLTVKTMGRMNAYGVTNVDNGTQCIVYSDSQDIWNTLGMAKHHAMKMEFESEVFSDPRSPVMGPAFSRSPSPEPIDRRLRCPSVDFSCYERDFTPSQMMSPVCKRGLVFADDIGKMIPSSAGRELIPDGREPSPLVLPPPAIEAPKPAAGGKPKKARRERKALLEYGKSPIFKQPIDPKRASVKPKRLRYGPCCAKCGAAMDDE